MNLYLLIFVLTLGNVALHAQDFTTPGAVAARIKYVALVGQSRDQYVVALKVVLKDVMKAGRLDEANNISKIIADPDANMEAALTSLRTKATNTIYRSAIQRTSQEYAASLKTALRQTLQGGQLEESNRISAEIKKMEAIIQVGAQGGVVQNKEMRALAPDTSKDSAFTIEANDQAGRLIGAAKKGQRVRVQYVDGKWTGLRNGDPVSPDETKSTMHQLTIIGTAGGKEELIVVVPSGTKQRAFPETLKKDYEEIRLRINDSPRGDNSGVVTYKASIK